MVLYVWFCTENCSCKSVCNFLHYKLNIKTTSFFLNLIEFLFTVRKQSLLKFFGWSKMVFYNVCIFANLTDFKWVLRPEIVETVDEVETVVQTKVAILWGAFLQTILDFLIIALALFIVMKVFNGAAAKAKAMREGMVDELKPKKLKKAEAEAAAKAAAEAEAKAEAEKKAAEEAAAKAEAEKKAELEAYAAQVAITENTTKLLTEIRDLLKEQK